MSRSSRFKPEREPFHEHPSLALAYNKVTGPFKGLNPTQAHYEHISSESKHDTVDSQTNPPTNAKTGTGIGYKWTSRNNRKGRHALTLTPSTDANPAIATPRSSSHPAEIAQGILRMLLRYPAWDVSFDVAYIFTWGSIVWVINAFFALLPFTNPSTIFDGEVLYGGGITAFIGATIFEVGSILLMLEAVNENRADCFGWAIEQFVDEHKHHQYAPSNGSTKSSQQIQVTPSDTCTHHHQNKSSFLSAPPTSPSTKPNPNPEKPTSPTPSSPKSWSWWPSTHDLKTHYIHELGFLACSAQMFGATIFWISGFTALPHILNNLSPHLEVGIYWVPQIIGGTGFIVSGTLFMLETQTHWYRPAFRELGWWIGLWNLIGGWGFTLCPCFGLCSANWAQEQAAVSTFWGSWAFLIGSVVQWYESLDKYPVQVRRRD